MPLARTDGPLRSVRSAPVAPQPALDPFCVEVHPDRQTARVVPVGELDLATVGQVDEHLHGIHDAGTRRLVLDLRRLTFLDSTGLHLAISWDARTRRRGTDFALIAGPPRVQRAFDLAGLTHELPFGDG